MSDTTKVLISPYPVTQLFPIEPLHELIDRNLISHGNNIALIEGDNGQRSFTFAEVHSISDFIAADLQANVKLCKGHVVALALVNRPEYLLILLGILKAGGIVSGVNPCYTVHEFVRQFEDSQSCVVVTSNLDLKFVADAVAQCKSGRIRRIYVVDKEPTVHCTSNGIPIIPINFNKNPSSLSHVKFVKPTFDPMVDVAFLPYSSGTTGIPKGVMLTHYNFTTQLNCCVSRDFLPMAKKGDYEVAVLPLFHIYGLVFALSALKAGVVSVLMRKFIWREFLKLLERYQIKAVCVAPPIMVLFAKSPDVTEFNLQHLQVLNVGAAPLGKELSEKVLDRLPNLVMIMQGFGMTELCGACFSTPFVTRDKIRHGSVGQLLPSFECKVVDVETRAALEAMQVGEFCLRGDCMTKGYWNCPDVTANAFSEDGFLLTGDIGYYDNGGYFYVVDRLKELIKVRGFQVPPAELEDLLLRHPAIKDAAVIGIPDVNAGELPRAYVVKVDGNMTLSEADVLAYVTEKVAYYKQLKGGVEFISEIPKSNSGKILRRKLREKYKKDVSSKL